MVEKHSRQELVQETIKMACCQTKIPKGAIFHSDRGCQYTAKKTKELLEQYGFRISMSRPGTPSDNQPIESFWKTLKTEITDIRHLAYEEAKQEIYEGLVNKGFDPRYYFFTNKTSQIIYKKDNNDSLKEINIYTKDGKTVELSKYSVLVKALVEGNIYNDNNKVVIYPIF